MMDKGSENFVSAFAFGYFCLREKEDCATACTTKRLHKSQPQKNFFILIISILQK